jgi:hypothetical protein
MFFLTVQRIQRDDGAAGEAEFGQQFLRCRDLVGPLGDVKVGEREQGIGGERAQHLGSGTITKIVEAAAQHLAIEGYASLPRRPVRGLEQGGLKAEDRLHRRRIEPLEDVADGGVPGRSAPGRLAPGCGLSKHPLITCDARAIVHAARSLPSRRPARRVSRACLGRLHR